MDITYLGHASFKLRGKNESVVCDPFDPSIGFSYPRVSADIVTVSHDHQDHNNFKAVSGTSRRDEPFVVQHPGEYEVQGISIHGFQTFHDAVKGVERGKNTVYVIQVDGLTVLHLGDLGHKLSDKQVERIGEVDIALVPVGGVYTISAKKAIEVVGQLQPSIVIPMHYKTQKHNKKMFGELATVEDFLQEGGFSQTQRLEKLTVSKIDLPEEMAVLVLTT